MSALRFPDVSAIDLSDVGFWKLPYEERDAAFALLREQDDPVFFKELRFPLLKSGEGYYALTRHADVVEASRTPEVFSNEPCANTIVDMPGYMARYFGSMINMDDPRHARLRRIVSRSFTPRKLAELDGYISDTAREIVERVEGDGCRDFVTQVAARLPVRVICRLMGIAEDRHEEILAQTNIILAGYDPEYLGGPVDLSLLSTVRMLGRWYVAGRRLHRLASDLGRRRRKAPTGDLTSLLVHANIDGERLTSQELGSFFILLVVAGAETTRTAIAHGLKLLTDHPDQRKLLLSDFDRYISGAVEEIIRYSSPVIQFRRTVTRDHVMNGHRFRKGDKVLLFYPSANRDAEVFENPDRFDITRTPNPHVGFGGHGPHYCLGTNLAKQEIKVMLRELLRRYPDIRSVGEPDRLWSNFVNGVKHLSFEIS
ncbi:cytochrome P450 [Microbispora cellulosiformans]|uniref:Cytochrome P450 n=1 Tax=Microbispora cellulosiformans TaxID=2614688 RepID=A0A5J5JTK1_9ACTN|nr:cytochrome P450 [Microbispora cellulosiformans]KAA9373301.1 cytochrome P450 [Microbispora cellulosiformans]